MSKNEAIELLNSGNVLDIINKYGQEKNIQIPNLTPPLMHAIYSEAVGYFVHTYRIDRILDTQGNIIRFFDSEV